MWCPKSLSHQVQPFPFIFDEKWKAKKQTNKKYYNGIGVDTKIKMDKFKI